MDKPKFYVGEMVYVDEDFNDVAKIDTVFKAEKHDSTGWLYKCVEVDKDKPLYFYAWEQKIYKVEKYTGE